MNKRLLTITAIFALGLSTPATLMACGETPAVVSSISIKNGEALKEPWRVGEASREVEIATEGADINVLNCLKEGKLTIESNNPDAVQVTSKMLTPKGVGAATITVTYNANGVVKAGEGVTEEQLATNKTASIDLVVMEMEKEPDYITDKKLGDLLAIPQSELVKDGSNFRSKNAYIFKVKVAALGKKDDGTTKADKYGNMWVTDEEGQNKVVVYGTTAAAKGLVYDKTSKSYKILTDKDFLTDEGTKNIAVGDTLDVIAVRQDYNTTKQILMIVRAVNGKQISNGTTTVEEINATELRTKEKQVLRSVTGVITKWKSGATDGTKYGNFYIKTEGKSEELYVYGASVLSAYPYSYESKGKTYTVNAPWVVNTDGTYQFKNPQAFLTNEESKTITIGTKVTVLGTRCDFNNVIEWNGVITSFTLPN